MINTATPIHKLHLELNGNRFYCKRDDLLPFSFGGNKVRKAVNFLKDIKANACDTVVTYGSSSSNHCRIIANMASQNGMKCFIISPEEEYHETSNTRMVQLFGAEIIKTPLEKVSNTIDVIMQKLQEECKPYFIMGGGHGNLGTQAYVDAYEEICAFEEESGTKFDYIFHATGTGTTQAGLVAGRIIYKNESQKIVGISIARMNPRGKQVVVDSLNDFFGDDKDYSDEVIFADDYICGGYAKFNKAITETIREVLMADGVPLNTTYTGKAFYGMKEYIKKNHIEQKNILFINTGGTPLFFDDLKNF